ncbi:Arginine deiminase [Paraburkholderia solisilvae]|uniref:arginine deiminase n=1 Tax=Paraburkholderia solisilvae TaxID=624376 RepID=A0A6J5DD97_9BURK|nr:Arginine deiminase [Paraburkholderia solisilvae]
MGFGVFSEVGTLRKVLVSRPGLAQARLTPLNCGELLFDDVLWVAQAKTDHFAFVNTMQEHDIEVFDVHDLLAETLQSDAAREWLLDQQLTPARVDAEIAAQLRPWLDEMKPAELATRMMGGLVVNELPFPAAGLTAPCVARDGFLLAPLPNAMFTRDYSCWINDGVAFGSMYCRRGARKRCSPRRSTGFTRSSKAPRRSGSATRTTRRRTARSKAAT